MIMIFSGHILRLLPFQSHPGFSGFRHYFAYSTTPSFHLIDNPQLFLDSVRQQCRLGFSTTEIPLSIFHQFNSFNPRLSILVFNELFTAMAKIKPHPPFSTVIALYTHLELSGLRPDCYSIGTLAKCYCGLGRLDFAFSLLGKRLKLGYPPDIIIINTLLNALMVSHKLNAVQMLDKIVKLGMKPDILTCGLIFKGLCSSGDISGALHLLRVMEFKTSLKPEIYIYSTIIGTLCKHRLLPQAREIFVLMTKRGVHANIVTYNALLDGYCLSGEMDEAEKLLDVMVKHGVTPDVVTFSTLINGYCKSTHVNKALELFYGMHLKGTSITPNVFTYNTMIDALCKDKRFQLALQLFKDMKDRGVAPDVVTYTSLFHNLLRNAHVDVAISLRKEMETSGVAPDIRAYNAMINGLCEAGRLVEANEALSFLVAKGLRPTVYTYTIKIKVLCQQGRLGEATKILKEMVDSECSPNGRTYNEIIKGLLRAHDIANALEHLHTMRNRGFAVHASIAPLFRSLLNDPNVGIIDKALLQKYLMENNDLRGREKNGQSKS